MLRVDARIEAHDLLPIELEALFFEGLGNHHNPLHFIRDFAQCRVGMFIYLNRVTALRLGVVAGGVRLRQNLADIAHGWMDLGNAETHP